MSAGKAQAVKALLKALKKYGQHGDKCTGGWEDLLNDRVLPCTCGLAAAYRRGQLAERGSVRKGR